MERSTGASSISAAKSWSFPSLRSTATRGKGRRPSFAEAARPDIAEPLYREFADHLRRFGPPVATGRFGADMRVESVNDGPFTLVLDTDSDGFSPTS